MSNIKGTQKAQLSLQVLLVGFVSTIVLSGMVLWVDGYVTNIARSEQKALAFSIAEAGIEYYRWHLAHDSDDFQDGTGEEGPYIHAYFDKDNERIGEFELEITAPSTSTGSGIVTIRSTGRVDGYEGLEKIIEVQMGLPSLARFSAISNSDVRFGEGTITYGQVHSNGGLRFDGVANNIVTSGKYDYNDPDHSGANEFGVHTHVSPVDDLPSEVSEPPVRTDVFKTGRRVGVPVVDFNSLTQDLANLKTLAQSSDGYYQGSSNDDGWHIVLKTSGKFDLYKVKKLENASYACRSGMWQTGWGKWSVQNESLVSSNVDLPANGVMFFEDDLWVEGQIDDARLTIAAGRFPENPSTWANIILNEDLVYTNYDGADVMALFAQGNILTGFDSADYLDIDAAVIAQNGFVGRYYYKQQCGNNYQRDTISLYGMIASNQRYGFAYSDGTGYANRVITYDGELLYGPPPAFPTTGSEYEIISWEEVK
ncbi:MAG: hypothetical protein R3B52_01000 [Candidatus Paceibacterota bacterium]